MQKNSSDLYEKIYIVKVFHNKRLHQELVNISPSLFTDLKRRSIVYLMKRLYENKVEITLDNLHVYGSHPDDHYLNFIRRTYVCKHGEEVKYILTLNELNDILYDTVIDASDNLFDMIKENLNVLTFARFVTQQLDEMKYGISFHNRDYHSDILARTKGIQTFHKLLFANESVKRNQLSETKNRINSNDEYISTSSQLLNSHIGGFTRGFVDAIIGKSGHGKSTWTDYNIVHTLRSGKVSKVVKITPEEPADFTWRRIISMVCNLSTTGMRNKLVKITDEHIKKVGELLEKRLKIYDNVFKLKDIKEVIRIADGDQLYVDHLQAIEYPGRANPLMNMIGEIPGLILFQERIAKQKNISIINLSQVGDKEIARSERFSKRPRYHDAYGSSVLYQKAREFLAVYYPYKDYDENPQTFYGTPPTMNDYEVGIEKSSFSALGIIHLNFDYEYSLFSDKAVDKRKLKTDYVAKNEPQLNAFGD